MNDQNKAGFRQHMRLAKQLKLNIKISVAPAVVAWIVGACVKFK